MQKLPAGVIVASLAEALSTMPEKVEPWLGQQARFEEQPVTVRYTAYSRSKGQPMVNAINVLIDFLFNRVK